MVTISDLKELITAAKDGNWIWIIAGCVMITISIILPIFFKWPAYWHPRYRIKIISFSLILMTVVSLSLMRLISTPLYFILIIMCVLMAWLMKRAINKILWPCTLFLRRAENDINEGNYDRAEERLSHCRGFFVDTLEKFEWRLLYAKTFALRGKDYRAYQIYYEINPIDLLQFEKERLSLCKAFSLVSMGDIKGAIADIPDILSGNIDLILWKASVLSLCQEGRGQLSEAAEILLDVINQDPTILKSKVIPLAYNNLARINGVERNVTNMLLYYEKSVLASIEMHNKYVFHVAIDNLILCQAKEKNFSSAEAWLQRYRDYIDHNNIRDLLEHNNLLIKYYRQIGDRGELLSAIEHGRSILHAKITDQEKLVFDISELRMRWNSRFFEPDYLSYIESQFDRYLTFEIRERYYAVKEISIVLRKLDENNLLGNFKRFYDNVMLQLIDMEPKIHSHLLSLPEYCVNEKCYWMKESAYLQKIRTGNYDFKKVLQRLLDIRSTYFDHENYIEALRAKLDIADEAMYQKNYPAAWQYVMDTIEELKNFRGHPVEQEAFIRIAAYAFFVGRRELAKEYFIKFQALGVSIEHFADWIQGYYNFLQKALLGNI